MDEFIPILQDLHHKIDAGFAGVYQKMESMSKETLEHRHNCAMKFGDVDKKFIQIDKSMAVKKAINSEKERHWKGWLWVIRGTILVVAAGALGFLWQLITGSAKIIIGG